MSRYLCKIVLLFFVINSQLMLADEAKSFDKYRRYLENSTWIVPPKTLLAYERVGEVNVAVLDQTVWVIYRYDSGYFFGDSYTAINGAATSHTSFVGSITPSGAVYITFYPITGDLLSTDVVNGVGEFKKKDGKHVFLMQMNSAQNDSSGLSHWSYMISVDSHDYFYRHLPSLDISVPDFISQF